MSPIRRTIFGLKAEKATYAPGEKVNITGRLLQDSIALANVYVSVEVRSPNKTVWLDAVKTDSSGVFKSSFKLASDAEIGTFVVYTTYPGLKESTTFNVA